MDIIGKIRDNMIVPESPAKKPHQGLSILRKKWIGLVILQILLLTAVSILLVAWWENQAALRWFGLAGIFSLVYFAALWRRLKFNHPPASSKILPNFGPGNLLTIFRGMLLMLLAGFLFSPWPQGWLAYVPGLLYVSAALADLFDGYLARISHHESRLGQELDLSLDGLGILIASILLVQYGQVPAWYLLVGLARYLFMGGIWLRKNLGKPVYPLAENSARRPFAGAQMGFAAVALFPVFSPPGTYLAAALFAVPFLVGFLLDWFTVSGISFVNLFKPYITWEQYPKLVYSAKKKFTEQVLNKWLPLSLRAALVILSIVWIHENILGLFQSLGNPTINQYLPNWPPIHWTGISMFLMFSGLILIAVGVAGRAAALLVLFGLGMYLEFFSLDLFEVGLVIAAMGLFYLGTGPYSLWIPERKIITQRLGEP